jgi:hypothetical protein
MPLEQSRDKSRRHPAEELPETGRIALSVAEFGKRTDLSRSLIYEAIKLGDLQSIKVRGRRLILVEDGISWLRSYRTAQ